MVRGLSREPRDLRLYAGKPEASKIEVINFISSFEVLPKVNGLELGARCTFRRTLGGSSEHPFHQFGGAGLREAS